MSSIIACSSPSAPGTSTRRGSLSSSSRPRDCASRRAGSMVRTTTVRPASAAASASAADVVVLPTPPEPQQTMIRVSRSAISSPRSMAGASGPRAGGRGAAAVTRRPRLRRWSSSRPASSNSEPTSIGPGQQRQLDRRAAQRLDVVPQGVLPGPALGVLGDLGGQRRRRSPSASCRWAAASAGSELGAGEPALGGAGHAVDGQHRLGGHVHDHRADRQRRPWSAPRSRRRSPAPACPRAGSPGAPRSAVSGAPP